MRHLKLFLTFSSSGAHLSGFFDAPFVIATEVYMYFIAVSAMVSQRLFLESIN